MQESERAKNEQRQELRKQGIGGKGPFRLRLNKGETRDIVILDASIDSCVGFREHNLKDANGRWGNYEPCIADTHNCPVCSKYGQEGYFVVMLTCLELTGYDRKDEHGNVIEHVPHSRMLLPIKLTQMDKWRQLEGAAINASGTMRGMYLRMQRGMDDKSIAIGEPSILDGGVMFWQYGEQELLQYFGHGPVLGRDGHTVLKEANADIQPFPYRNIFLPPNPADLIARFGTVGVGSPAAAAQEFNQPQAPRPQGGTRTAQGGNPPPPAAGGAAFAPPQANAHAPAPGTQTGNVGTPGAPPPPQAAPRPRPAQPVAQRPVQQQPVQQQQPQAQAGQADDVPFN